MARLVCNQFKTESFSNGDSLAWDDCINYVDSLEEIYSFERGVKDLFYSLLQTGTCYSVSDERIMVVQDVLMSEGYEIDEVM